MSKLKLVILLLLSTVVGATSTFAQESAEEMSKQAANPIANLMSIPFQNNLNMNYGPFDRNVNILNIQPVIPFANGKIITRTIVPIVRVPNFFAESGTSSTGLADIVETVFFVPESKNVIWGVGPVFELPTGGSKRGSEKWSIGPSFLALVQPGDWTLGGILNNTWSIAGNENRSDVNHMLLNLFIVKQMGDGWYVNSAPIITADWTKDNDKWIVPLGAGGGRLVMLGGKLPLNLQSQLYYNVVRPDFGPEWQWRIQVQTFLPKSIFTGGK